MMAPFQRESWQDMEVSSQKGFFPCQIDRDRNRKRCQVWQIVNGSRKLLIDDIENWLAQLQHWLTPWSYCYNHAIKLQDKIQRPAENPTSCTEACVTLE